MRFRFFFAFMLPNFVFLSARKKQSGTASIYKIEAYTV